MPDGYYRNPTIHEETVVFKCEDDLWTVSADGGIARRLTANLGEVLTPALSSDGQQLAFIGQEDGEEEVYCMPAIGGPATRLTFLGAGSQIVGWHPDGETIIFASDVGQPFHSMFQLYRIPHTGGQPELLPVGHAVSISYGSDGGIVIGRNVSDLARWKRYRGGRTGNLWIDVDGSNNWQRLIRLEGNVARPLWIGDRIYFVSDHEGIGNLYSCTPHGEDIQRHTDHDDYYVRHISTDGRRLVYHAGADLYLYDPVNDTEQPISVEFHSPRVQRSRKFVDAAEFLEDYDLHPAGHSVAVATRGKLFAMANWEKAVVQQGELQGVRYRLPTWLKDGKRLVLVSDADGEEALEIHAADASAQPERLTNLELGRVITMALSPVDDILALCNHRQELIVVDLVAKTSRVLDQSQYYLIYSFSWSPDGRWLAYSYYNSHQTCILKLCLLETGETWEITRTLLRDMSPSFDPGGKYLYFLSSRDFDPIYDSLHFELSFPTSMRPYLITLQADLPSPFLPVPRPPGESMPKSSEDSDDDDDDDDNDTNSNASADETNDAPDQTNADTSEPSSDDGEEKSDDEKNKKDKVKPVKIDLDGIQDRIIAFPASRGRYRKIVGIKGKALFDSYPMIAAKGRRRLNAPPSASGTLLAYDFESQEKETLVRGISGFAVSLNNKSLIYRAGNDLRVLKAGEKPDNNYGGTDRKSGWLDLSRIKVAIEPPAEWAQMLRDAWRLQRDYFWTDDMSAVDWKMVYERYLPLVDRIASRSEFTDLLWEMQGELGTSHAYVQGGDYRMEPTNYQGLLGADFSYDAATDSYRVTNILRGDVWNERLSSPLSQPGLNIQPGDRLVAVNRRKVSASLSPQALLVNQAGEEVLLTFIKEGKDENTEPRTVSVKTLYYEFGVRYRAWVEANRQRVHQATDGRVGYIHIPDMGGEGFAEFHRGYLAELEREGLIIDVRYNAGGNVSSLILEKLARKRIGYDVSRWQAPEPYPRESPAGPMVALANERTSSDGDMFSHAFKLLKLGPLIGTRTWGGVIGYSNTDDLTDGGSTTQPQFSNWFQDVGWQLENYGTDPDIYVEVRPQDYAAGEDPQLARAIEEITRILTEAPPQMPDFSNRPKLPLPKLPKRG